MHLETLKSLLWKYSNYNCYMFREIIFLLKWGGGEQCLVLITWYTHTNAFHLR